MKHQEINIEREAIKQAIEGTTSNKEAENNLLALAQADAALMAALVEPHLHRIVQDKISTFRCNQRAKVMNLTKRFDPIHIEAATAKMRLIDEFRLPSGIPVAKARRADFIAAADLSAKQKSAAALNERLYQLCANALGNDDATFEELRSDEDFIRLRQEAEQ